MTRTTMTETNAATCATTTSPASPPAVSPAASERGQGAVWHTARLTVPSTR